MALKNDADLIVLSIINSRELGCVGSIVAMGYEVDADHYIDEVRKERKQKLNKMTGDLKN